MSTVRTTKQLAEKTEELQHTFLIQDGWTASPPPDGGCSLYTKTVDGVDFVFGVGTATLVQRWLKDVL